MNYLEEEGLFIFDLNVRGGFAKKKKKMIIVA